MTANVIFIIDRSGSMGGLESDTIGGFNGFIKDQKESSPDALLTTVLFDDTYKVLHNNVRISDVPEMTRKEYYVGNSTALYDAMGKTIKNIEQKVLLSTEVIDKVIFVITTDGQENSSREYTRQAVQDMVKYCREHYGWEFLFLGANIDAFATGRSLGINYTSQYTANEVGTQSLYQTVSKTVSGYVSSTKIDEDWNKDVK
jgi:hypothetical protein